ncbi:MAG: class I SAM-dependent DNA methyltransferase [Clostridium sp.]
MAYNKFAKIYDELINEDINYEEMASFIIEKSRELNIKEENYLDLACGTGNVTVQVGKHFKDIYGVDLSEEMLREAYDKLREKRIKGKIICQDISELELNRSFDLITCVLDSSNYITDYNDLKSYFKCVHNHLNEDGLFVFDINSYYKLSNVLGNNVFIYNEDNTFYTWENQFEDDICSMFLTFFVREGELFERFDEEHEERAYTLLEIEEALKEANLKIINKYNGYKNEEVHEESERIVFFVKKDN